MLERYPLGLSRERAELYGKPHIGATYTSGGRYRHTADWCPICGRPAGSVHHIARKSWAVEVPLVTDKGAWTLRSPLVTLCGTGTIGCHGRMHDGGLVMSWEWYRPSYEDLWWDGSLLAEHGPHSPALYRYGCWVILDTDTHSELRIRRDR